METSATANLAETTCAICGQRFFYEPIHILGRDFALTLNLTCDTCTEAAEKEEERKRIERQRMETEALIRRTVPCDLLDTDINFPTFNRELWEFVSKWRPDKSRLWLGIVGAADRSKTRCMALLAARGMRSGVESVWISAIELYEAARDANHRDRLIYEPARARIRECTTARTLYVDDFGKNEWSSSFEIQLFKILDHRKNHRLTTIYSSNAHPEAFGTVISDLNREPIIGRMLDRVTLIDLRKTKD